VLRPQRFSRSRRFDSTRYPAALLHAADALGLLTFRGFPPPVASLTSRPDLPPLPLAVRSSPHACARFASRPSRLRGFQHPAGPYHRCQCYPTLRWPILSWRFTPTRCSPPRPWPRASTWPPLLGFGTSLRDESPVFVPALQSVKEPRNGLALFRELPTSPRFVPPRPGFPGCPAPPHRVDLSGSAPKENHFANLSQDQRKCSRSTPYYTFAPLPTKPDPSTDTAPYPQADREI
jgi:hypothetical protein